MLADERPRDADAGDEAATARIEKITRITGILIVLALAWYFLGDRFTPSTSVARVSGRVVPIDLESGSNLRKDFYRGLVKRSEAQIDAYWAQLIFAGRMKPLRRAGAAAEVIELVRNEPRAIGYLREEDLQPGVRVILRLDEEG